MTLDMFPTEVCEQTAGAQVTAMPNSRAQPSARPLAPSQHEQPTTGPLVRVGIPLTGGKLVAAARERNMPVLFSANAFARVYAEGHERAGDFRSFAKPDLKQFDGLDAALDSAGFVAAVRYGDFRWSVSDYYDLVESYPWAFHASMDYCVEKEVAEDRATRLIRIAATAKKYLECSQEAERRGVPQPMPVLQGWEPRDYKLCAEWMPIKEWPDLVGIGSVCRRAVHGPDGILSILEAIDEILPPNCKVHLFGVKSTAMAMLATHPRVYSVDSMAWDVQARNARRTGRDMEFRIEHMAAWAHRQTEIAAQASKEPGGWQTSLFGVDQVGQTTDWEKVLLEAVATLHAEYILEGTLEYKEAAWQAAQESVYGLAILRHEHPGPIKGEVPANVVEALNEHSDRLGDEFARLLQEAREAGLLPETRFACRGPAR